jgi:tetratricopeptide (TPR) repeat protein
MSVRSGQRLRAVLVGLILHVAALPCSAHPDLDVAIARVTAQIAAQPAQPDLYLSRAELYRRHGDFAAALADYGRAVQHGFDEERLHFYRGRALLEAGQPQRALEELNLLLAVRPGHPGALALRARIPGRPPAAAAADLDRALAQLRTPTPDLYVLRARLLAATTPAGTALALRSLDEAIDRLGPLVSLVDVAVAMCQREGLVARALGFIERLPQAVRDSALWRVRRADVLYAGDRFAPARDEYLAARQAIEALPAPRRQTRALRALDEHVRARLADAPDVPAAPAPPRGD